MKLLIRWIAFFILIAFALACGLWVAEHPGTIQIDWQGYRLTTSFWFMLLALGVALLLLLAAMMGLNALLGRLSGKNNIRQQKKLERGLEALTHVIADLSSSDFRHAALHLEQSKRYLGADAPLNVLLQAHLASKTRDDVSMSAALKKMQEFDSTRYVAYRTQSAIAEREKNITEALELAREAYQLRPDMKDTMIRYLGLLLKNSRFFEAEALVRQAKGNRVLNKQEMSHYLAITYHADYAATPEGVSSSLLEKAFKLDASFPATYPYIIELQRQGKTRQALQALYKAWKQRPHSELVDILLHYFAEDHADKLLKRAMVLHRQHPTHLESQIAVGRAALAAKRWDVAREYLNKALQIEPQARIYRLLATIEEQGYDDEIAAAAWLKKMHTAKVDPAWHCHNCGHTHSHWQADCRSCGSFDSYEWSARSNAIVSGHSSDTMFESIDSDYAKNH